MASQMLILPSRDQVPENNSSDSERFLKKTRTCRLNHRDHQHQQYDPIGKVHEASSLTAPDSHIQLTPCELAICLNILVAGPASYISRERRRGGLLIPANFLQIVPHILLIERLLGHSRFIFFGRPKTRGIWRKYFICKSYSRQGTAKLKFGIGDDDALLPGIISGFSVNREAEIPQPASVFWVHELGHLLERNVFVMPGGRLCCRSEDRLGQLV